jgi:hypothetical protein
MKLQLDFDKKTIKIDGKEKLKDVVKILDGLKIDWKNWYLETSTVINDRYYYPWYSYSYPHRCIYESGATTTAPQMDAIDTLTDKGIINIEV